MGNCLSLVHSGATALEALLFLVLCALANLSAADMPGKKDVEAGKEDVEASNSGVR